jgi:hypothetical protein
MFTDMEHSLGSPEVAVESASLQKEEKKNFRNNNLQSNRLQGAQKVTKEREMRNV